MTRSSWPSPVRSAGAPKRPSSARESGRGCSAARSTRRSGVAAPRPLSRCRCSRSPEVAHRRSELLVGLSAASFGAASVALEGNGLDGVVAGAVVGGALGGARRHARAAWIVSVVALLATASYVPPSFGLTVLVAAHAFCAGRWEGRWVGV